MITLRGNNNAGVSNGGGTTARIIPASLPTKLEYVEGEALDISGLTLNFEEVGSEPSSISTFSTIPNNGTNLTRHNESIQVDYKNDGKIYSLNIPIKVKYPVGLRVNYLKKTNYNIDESINLAGADIVIVYNDNSEKSIENNTGVTTTPTTYDGSTKLIKFSYSDGSIELNTNYEINKSKELAGYIDPRIVTFASGSWEDIGSMLERHKNGEINIADYWKVGDARKLYNKDGMSTYGTLVIYDLNGTLEDGTKYNIAIGRKESLGAIPNGYGSDKYVVYKDILFNIGAESLYRFRSNIFFNNGFGLLMKHADGQHNYYQDNFFDKYIDDTYKKINRYYDDKYYHKYINYGSGFMLYDGYRKRLDNNAAYFLYFYGSDINISIENANFIKIDSNTNTVEFKEKNNNNNYFKKINILNLDKNLIRFSTYANVYVGDFYGIHSNSNLSPVYKCRNSGSSPNEHIYRVFNNVKYKYYKTRLLPDNNFNGTVDNNFKSDIMYLSERELFGDNAFEYFKTTNNRIFTYNGVPSKYIIPDYAIDETFFDNKEYDYAVSGKYDIDTSNSHYGSIFVIKDNHVHLSGHKTITHMYKIVDEHGSLVDVLNGIKRFDATDDEMRQYIKQLYSSIMFKYGYDYYAPIQCCFFV